MIDIGDTFTFDEMFGVSEHLYDLGEKWYNIHRGKDNDSMTNFEPIKNRIWDAVKSDNRDDFNRECDALMEKAAKDIWRIGWNIHPKDIDEMLKMLGDVRDAVHKMWLEAMECGDAPHEDVSPGEGFQRLIDLVKENCRK